MSKVGRDKKQELRRLMAWFMISFVCVALHATNPALCVDASDTKISGQVRIKGSDAPPPETLIEVFKRGTQTKVGEGRTEGSRGLYQIARIPEPGTYDFRATPRAPYKKTSVSRDLVSGPNTVDLEVEHPVSSKVGGLATSGSKAVVAKARVCVYAPDNDDFEIDCTTTDQFGAYSFLLAPNRNGRMRSGIHRMQRRYSHQLH